jgi:CheY-like chemotaxis protein
MDLQMPVMNGFESTRLMREFEKNERKSQPPTPIVALTAYTSKSDIDKAIEAGCNDYIAKPVGRMDLINYIESIDPIALTSGLSSKRTA